jgi:hypothetical protein
LNRVQKQVNEVVDDMRINLQKVVERGESLTELNDRSDELSMSADMFSRRSKSLRKSMWLRTCRARLYLGIIISVIVLLILCKKIFYMNIFKLNREISSFYSFLKSFFTERLPKNSHESF